MNNIYEVVTPTDMEIPFFYTPEEYITERRVKELKKLFDTEHVTPTGSRHIESPPKMGTDDDYLIYLFNSSSNIAGWRKELVTAGWLDCLDQASPGFEERYKEENLDITQWGAFRKGEVNIVVYLDENLYINSYHATSLCKKLNVKDKERRIRIFRWYKFNEPLKEGDLSIS